MTVDIWPRFKADERMSYEAAQKLIHASRANHVTDDIVLKLLGVNRLSEYAGLMRDAWAAVRAYIQEDDEPSYAGYGYPDDDGETYDDYF